MELIWLGIMAALVFAAGHTLAEYQADKRYWRTLGRLIADSDKLTREDAEDFMFSRANWPGPVTPVEPV